MRHPVYLYAPIVPYLEYHNCYVSTHDLSVFNLFRPQPIEFCHRTNLIYNYQRSDNDKLEAQGRP